jgi:hypothetical protein
MRQNNNNYSSIMRPTWEPAYSRASSRKNKVSMPWEFKAVSLSRNPAEIVEGELSSFLE